MPHDFQQRELASIFLIAFYSEPENLFVINKYYNNALSGSFADQECIYTYLGILDTLRYFIRQV